MADRRQPVPGLHHLERFKGATLRDWFAAHASEQDILHWRASFDEESTITRTREQARYAYADAMIAERSKPACEASHTTA